MKKLRDLYRHKNQILNDAFDRIVVEIHLSKQKNNYKSFLVSGCEPGVGTTTISINLAISMALSGWKTVLVDADMRKGTDYKRLNEDTEKGLSELLESDIKASDILYSTNYDLLHYVPSGIADKNAVSLLCSVKMQEFMEMLNEKYDYIIFDFPSIHTAVDTNIIASNVDAVVLVTTQGTGDIKAVEKAKMKLDKIGANLLGIIVNKVEFSEYKREMKNYDYFKKKKFAKERTHKYKQIETN